MIESKLKAKNCKRIDRCFDLVGSRQHGVASYKVISWSTDHPYPLNTDGDDLRSNSNPNLCQLANVTCKTRDKGQEEKPKISCRCRDKATADRHKLSRRKIMHGQTMSKMSGISDLIRSTAPKNTGQFNIMMQRTANENAACLSRICKRSDQPKIQRIANNDEQGWSGRRKFVLNIRRCVNFAVVFDLSSFYFSGLAG